MHKEPIESLSCIYANSVERQMFCFKQTKVYEQAEKEYERLKKLGYTMGI